MNKQRLQSVMIMNADTQKSLAEAMGISLSRLNAKLNTRGGAAFTQGEITFIIERYQLAPEDAMQIFFSSAVS